MTVYDTDPDLPAFWNPAYADAAEAAAKLDAARRALARMRARDAFLRAARMRFVEQGKAGLVANVDRQLPEVAGFAISRAGWVTFWEAQVADPRPVRDELEDYV